MKLACLFAVLVASTLVTTTSHAIDVPPAVLAEIQNNVRTVVSDAIGPGSSGDFGLFDAMHWRVSFGDRNVSFPQPLSVTCNEGQACDGFFAALSGRFTITTALPLRVQVAGKFKVWGAALLGQTEGDFDLDKTLQVSVTMPVQWIDEVPVPLPGEGTVVFAQQHGGNVEVTGLIGEGVQFGAITSVVTPWAVGFGAVLGGILGNVAEGKVEDYIKKRFKAALAAAATEQADALLQLAADLYNRIIGLAVATLMGIGPLRP